MCSLGTANTRKDDFKMGDNSWELQLESIAKAMEWYQPPMPTTFDHANTGSYALVPQYQHGLHLQQIQQSYPPQPYQHSESLQHNDYSRRYQQAQQLQQVTYSQQYAIDPRLRYPNALIHDFPAVPPARQLGTIGYQLALRNRIAAKDVSDRYDVARFPPIFLHGVLTFPGSLAAVLGKESETAIISRMTPGYIPGWQVVVDQDLQEAHLSQTSGPGGAAFGMILFGQGARARALIRKHYYLGKALTLEATCEVVRGIPRAARGLTEPRRVFQMTQVRVHAFTLDQKDLIESLPPVLKAWSMEEFLAGEYV